MINCILFKKLTLRFLNDGDYRFSGEFIDTTLRILRDIDKPEPTGTNWFKIQIMINCIYKYLSNKTYTSSGS